MELAQAPEPSPAGQANTEDIPCPLCSYNLRGLTEPRCPECGYRFTWPELRARRDAIHPYLFEHHPERNIRSFLRTLWETLRPRRFWNSLSPLHEPRPGRLTIYWGIIAVFLLTSSLGVSVVQVAGQHIFNVLTGQRVSPLVQSYQYRHFPPPQLLSAPSNVDLVLDLTIYQPLLSLGVILCLWPWLTLAALMIFRVSMRRARVRPVHVMRCVIYSGDILFWLSAMLCLWCVWCIADYARGRPMSVGPNSARWTFVTSVDLTLKEPQLSNTLSWFCWLSASLLIYRLWISYRRYLRFDHALATVLASQVIVGLLLLIWRCNTDYMFLPRLLSWID